MSTNPHLPNLAAAAAEIRAWDAIAVVGAGISVAARLPMSASLDMLVWHALEADPAALAELQAQTHRSDLSSRETIDELGFGDPRIWGALGASVVARKRFQNGFASLDAERRGAFSSAHDALAHMLHRREVELVVSLNWDTQLEAAWSARYGQGQTIHWRLIKPHGDASRPEEPWVLPGDKRELPAELVHRLGALAAERPRVLFVVGYAEADELIVQELIAPLEERWKVVA